MSADRPGWVRALPNGVVVGCATLGPIGMRLPAPGTWGSAVGALLFALVLAGRVGPLGMLVVSAIGFYLAVAFCAEAEVRMGRSDPGEVIFDEVAAMPLCFLGWPLFLDVAPFWGIVLTGFALFRLFDIWKPLGIKKLQRLPGGWGITIDDTVAALATCATMHLAHWVWISVQAQ